jgi:hypothetical protein
MTFRRFETLYTRTDGCWIWQGSPYRQTGYGRFGNKLAHRLSYEKHKGDIPDGMIVCHRCDTPLCINPDHLFLGTMRDNSLDMSSKGRARNGFGVQRKTHCVNGHEFTEENTYHRLGTARGRACRICIKARAHKHYEEKGRAQQGWSPRGSKSCS